MVGLYLLDKLSKLIGRENVELYRDDGLAASNSSSSENVLEKNKKEYHCFVERLLINIENNLFETDFFVVTFNLETEKFSPFRKSNNQLHYINAKSNHPPTFIITTITTVQ